MKKKLYILTTTIIFLLLSINSCSNFAEQQIEYEAGTLVLTLSNSESRTITPNIDMTITTYTIQGTGPHSQSFSVTQASDSPIFVQDNLRAGDWTITVTGQNTNSETVGTGTADVTISQLNSTEVNVTIEPIEGYGDCNVHISWLSDETVEPYTSAYLIKQEDIPAYLDPEMECNIIDLALVVTRNLTLGSTQTINYYKSITAGYYLLVTVLEDEDIVIWNNNDIIRIVAGELTDINYYLEEDDLNQLEGNLSMNITENMNAPLELSLEFSDMNYKTTSNYYAPISAGDNSYESYLWLLDGIDINKPYNNNILIELLEADRVYYLTVIATDGNQIGSASISFLGSYYVDNYNLFNNM